MTTTGNILADPISKQIIFLDLGLVGQLNSQQRVDLLGLIYAIKEVDIPGIGDGMMALGKPTATFDEAGFRSLMQQQREMAKADSKAKKLGHVDVSAYRGLLDAAGASEFTGYSEVVSEGTVKVHVELQPRDTSPADLNVIGCTVDEAIARAERFLDESLLTDQRVVRFIHGYGTGQLKRALNGFLQQHPLVARFATAPPEQGGGGVTVVELKE